MSVCSHFTHTEAQTALPAVSGARGAGRSIAPGTTSRHIPCASPWPEVAVETRGAARFCRDFFYILNAPGCYTSGWHQSGCFPAPTDATRPQTRNCMSWCVGAELVRAKHILILQFNISDQSRPRALTCCVHHPKCASRTTKPTRCFIILYMRSALRKCTRGSVVSFSTFQIRINAALLILTLDF